MKTLIGPGREEDIRNAIVTARYQRVDRMFNEADRRHPGLLKAIASRRMVWEVNAWAADWRGEYAQLQAQLGAAGGES